MLGNKVINVAFGSLAFFFIYIFLYNLIHFQGNKFIYFLFTILSFYLIVSIFFEKKYFSEIFLGIYLWLGFWWKYSILQWMNKSEAIVLSSSEGFNSRVVDPNILNDTFYSLIIAFLAIILAFKVFKFFFGEYFNKEYRSESVFSNLYYNHRNLIIQCYLFLFIFVGITNVYFGIYQKGLLASPDLNLIIIFIYKWLVLFGISIVGSTILFYEIKNKNKNIYFISLLVLFENFFISTTNFSRAMILNSSAIIYGLHKNLEILNKKNFYLVFKLLVVLFFLFFLSLTISVKLRAKFFTWDYNVTKANFLENNIEIKKYKKNEIFIEKEKINFSDLDRNEKISNEKIPDDRTFTEKILMFKNKTIVAANKTIIALKNSILQVWYLSSKRWVGMDSMIMVSDNTQRNFNTFLYSLSDKFSKSENPYYEKFFINKFNKSGYGDFPDREIVKYNKAGQQLYGVLTPGFISFFHYSNNSFFLFFSIFFTVIVAMLFERFFSFLSGNNLILVSFLSHTTIYRLIHFGYLPQQTYLLFGSIFANLVLFYLIKQLYLKINTK